MKGQPKPKGLKMRGGTIHANGHPLPLKGRRASSSFGRTIPDIPAKKPTIEGQK